MRVIVTEKVLSMSPATEAGAGTIYDTESVTIRVMDEAAGPFLMIFGATDVVTDRGEPIPGSFCFDSVVQIRQFARECEAMLKAANRAQKG